MKTREKLRYLVSSALVMLYEMRGIENENREDEALAAQAEHEMMAAFAGSTALAPDEQEVLLPLMSAYRKLVALGIDHDDGQSAEEWDAEIAAMMPTEIKSGLVAVTDGEDLSHIEF